MYKSQLVTMIMFNLMTNKKVHWTGPLTRAVHLHMNKAKNSSFNKNNVATFKTNKILTKIV